MPLEIVAVVLSVIALTAVATMVLLACAGLVDQPAIVRCPGCTHWMIDTDHQPGAECHRCRHPHGHLHVGLR